jgi:hypothetical protein
MVAMVPFDGHEGDAQAPHQLDQDADADQLVDDREQLQAV